MNRFAAAATAVLTLVALGGCAVGSSRTPDSARIGLDSVDGRIGDLRLLSVSVGSPGGRGSIHVAGDSVVLLLTVANDGDAEDELVGASTDTAEQIVLRDGDAAPDRRIGALVPAGGVAVLREVTGPHLELSGLHERLPSGSSVPVTFEFRDAGPVTLSVPIGTYDDVRPDRFSSALE